ncbi:MAG: hypothetical protein V4484_20340 [Pseudomonadota bacterium]
MLDDIGNGMAAGFRAGVRIGEQMQQEEAINAWDRYASDLEQQLEQAKSVIAHQNIDLEYKSALLDIERDEKKVLSALVQDINGQLGEKIQEISKTAVAEIKREKFLAAKIKSIERACAAQSAISTVYEGIYKFLVLEIQTKHDPSAFESLDFAKRAKMIDELAEGFRKTGKMLHNPDTDFKYQVRSPAP